jgi:hypothetical protein
MIGGQENGPVYGPARRPANYASPPKPRRLAADRIRGFAKGARKYGYSGAQFANANPITAYMIVGAVFWFLIALPIYVWGLTPNPSTQQEQYTYDTRVTVIAAFVLLGLFAFILAFIKQGRFFCT